MMRFVSILPLRCCLAPLRLLDTAVVICYKRNLWGGNATKHGLETKTVRGRITSCSKSNLSNWLKLSENDFKKCISTVACL